MNDTQPSEQKLAKLNTQFSESEPEEILSWADEEFGDNAVLSTGFGPSGLVLMHKLSRIRPGARVFYLDTDLLFGETYQLIDRLREALDIEITHVRSHLSLEEQERQYGKELWKTNPDKCCYLRKVLPMQAFMHDKTAWITGLRQDQSVSRVHTPVIGYDEQFGVIKISPLARWTEEQVWSYIHLYSIPYNELHDEGYPSIGCIPCTNPVKPGEDNRSGRWAGLKKNECGIHHTSKTNSS